MKGEFIGTCVENPFDRIELLVEVVENAKEITKRTFLKNNCVHPDIIKEMRRFPNDYMFYRNKNIDFYEWSAIEHFYERR